MAPAWGERSHRQPHCLAMYSRRMHGRRHSSWGALSQRCSAPGRRRCWRWWCGDVTSASGLGVVRGVCGILQCAFRGAHAIANCVADTARRLRHICGGIGGVETTRTYAVDSHSDISAAVGHVHGDGRALIRIAKWTSSTRANLEKSRDGILSSAVYVCLRDNWILFRASHIPTTKLCTRSPQPCQSSTA